MKLVDIVKCRNCYGSGKIMGGGMMSVKCKICEGRGKVEQVRVKQSMTYLELLKTNAYEDQVVRLIKDGKTRQQAIIAILKEFHSADTGVKADEQKRKYTKKRKTTEDVSSTDSALDTESTEVAGIGEDA